MDIQYLLALQDLRISLGGGVESFFNGISALGGGVLALGLAAIIYWCVDKRMGFTALLSFGLGNFVNQFVKDIACVYRPWIGHPEVIPSSGAVGGATGYSFPSGHVVASTTSLGTIGWLARNKSKALTVFCFVMIALIAFSRNYLGVHTPQDVLVALAESIIVIAVSCKVVAWLEEHRERDLQLLIGSLVLSAIVLIIVVMKPYPYDYVDGLLLVDPAVMQIDCFEGVGIFAGLMTGWYCERRWVNFTTAVTEVSIPQRIARLVIGVVYVALIMLGLDPLFKATLGLAGAKLLSRFLILLGISFLVPLLFKRIDAAVARRTN